MAEYISNIPQFKQEMNKSAVQGLEQAGSMVVKEASSNAPVLSGELRDSYQHMVDEGEKKLMVGSNADHALSVEKGTYKMSAQPHLTPAVEGNRSAIEHLLKGAFNF